MIEDASASILRAFLSDNVEPGARVITDGWRAYPEATRGLYEHDPTSVSDSGLEAHEVLPAAHLVFSLVKRWVLSLLLWHGASPAYLASFSVVELAR